jgi:hypothetical protein
MFKNPFKKKKPEEPDEELVPTPIPALITILVSKEREKGSPLKEGEVLEIRDKAVCIMLPISAKEKMEESRGYPDLNPEYVWEQWLEARIEFIEKS